MPALKGEKTLLASLDMSGNTARFALARADGSVICRTRKPMRQREAAALADFVFESLQCADRDIREIGHWTIGSGPGSFTGMRLAAALVCGLSRRNGVKVRCIPTACAIADTADIPVGSRVVVLFDGRNHEIIAYELLRTPAGAMPLGMNKVLNAEQAKTYFAERADAALVVQSCDLAAVAPFLPPEAAPITVENFDPAMLIASQVRDYDGVFSDLEYIRPAVFPKK